MISKRYKMRKKNPKKVKTKVYKVNKSDAYNYINSNAFYISKKSKCLHGDCLGQLIAHYSKHNELIGFIFAG